MNNWYLHVQAVKLKHVKKNNDLHSLTLLSLWSNVYILLVEQCYKVMWI